MDGDLAEAKATELANCAMVNQATLNLSFTEVRAPVEAGSGGKSLLSATSCRDDSVLRHGADRIVSVDKVYVYFEAPEGERSAIGGRCGDKLASRRNDRSEVGLFDEAGYPQRGSSTSSMSARPGTGTQTSRASEKPNRRLFAEGMFARVKVAFSSHTEARRRRPGGRHRQGTSSLRRRVSDTVEDRPVELGRLIGPGLRQVGAG